MQQKCNWFEQDHPVTLRDWSLDVAIEDILRMQAADAAKVVERKPVLINAAEEAQSLGATVLEPVVLFRMLKVEELLHERLILAGSIPLRSPLITQHFAGSEVVAAALCTIGSAIEDLIRKYFKANPILGLALEGFGSAAVERLATDFCSFVDKEARVAGMESSIPLSPGMVDWPLEEGQHQIFRILDGSSIGVVLTSSSMMLPMKTISLIIAMGANMRQAGSTCDFCGMRERCNYRDHYLDVEAN